MLERIRPGAERIDVGKVGHAGHVTQESIHERLIAKARAGAAVVRLKAGCPTVFGRLAEEAAALRAAGVPFEIVPGVSSALAVPAYAGIPVTDRTLVMPANPKLGPLLLAIAARLAERQ